MNEKTSIKISSNSSDEDLYFGCCQDNLRAQEYLYQRWYGDFMGICLRYTSSRDEAKEVLNQAFFKIFKSVKNYQPKAEGSFSGWMARIVFHTAIDQVRREAKYKKRYDFEIDVDQSVENEALGMLAAEDIFQLVQQLPSTTRTVFSLFALDGYKHAEIADLLKIGEATSRWHLSQARKQLRVLVNKNC